MDSTDRIMMAFTLQKYLQGKSGLALNKTQMLLKLLTVHEAYLTAGFTRMIENE